jgi:hypothetical protein
MRESKARRVMLAMPQDLELRDGPRYFTRTDGSGHLFLSAFDSEAERRAAWHSRRGEITTGPKAGRPWAWWWYEASDADRARLRASGDERERRLDALLTEAAVATEFVGTEAPRLQ